MPIRLSCHAITWGPDTLGAIRDISDLGYEGIETFTIVAEQYRTEPGLFRRVLDNHGLRLVALYGGGDMLPETRDKDVEYNLRLAEFVAACGGSRLNLGGGRRRTDAAGREIWTSDDLKHLGETLTIIGDRCLKVGVKAHYHPHINTLGEEKENIDRIFAACTLGRVYVGPDPAHLFLGGYDPLEFFRKYRPHIVYCHFKDVPARYTPQNWRQVSGLGGGPRGGPNAASGGSAAAQEILPLFCELGDGQLDLKGLVQFLRDTNYDGWITTEVDSTTLPSPRASAERNKRFWQELGFTFRR